MNSETLITLGNNWGIGVFQCLEPETEQASHEEDAAGVNPSGVLPTPPSECCGDSVTVQTSDGLAMDVERLKDIMRVHLIRPHLHEGGGSGFSYPYAGEWRKKNDAVIAEFSKLWFSAAGDVIIEQYGHRMRVIPISDWRRTVHVLPWLPDPDSERDQPTAIAEAPPPGRFFPA